MNPQHPILITAGPTREPIDSVRYLSNRSSGTLGIALAEAAAQAGHTVTLLLGPIEQPPPPASPNLAVHRFETTDQLAQLLTHHFPTCRTLIMAAAVADYKPANPPVGSDVNHANQAKLERSPAGLTLHLQPTTDLLAAVAETKQPHQTVIAFALEHPDHLEQRAADKLKRKHADAIVANPLETMGAPTINPILLTALGQRHAPGPLTKQQFAQRLINWIANRNEL